MLCVRVRWESSDGLCARRENNFIWWRVESVKQSWVCCCFRWHMVSILISLMNASMQNSRCYRLVIFSSVRTVHGCVCAVCIPVDRFHQRFGIFFTIHADTDTQTIWASHSVPLGMIRANNGIYFIYFFARRYRAVIGTQIQSIIQSLAIGLNIDAALCFSFSSVCVCACVCAGCAQPGTVHTPNKFFKSILMKFQNAIRSINS